jgi:hypothetical protein
VDRSNRFTEAGNIIKGIGQEAHEGKNINQGNVQADKFISVGGTRNEQPQQNGKDVLIIRNYDENQGKRNSQVNRQYENAVSVNRENTIKPNDSWDTRSNSIRNNPTNSNNTYRNWNTGGRENFNIERRQEGGQRSGTFTEGSRTYQNNYNFFNHSEQRNSIQPIQQPQPFKGNNQGGSVPSQRPR